MSQTTSGREMASQRRVRLDGVWDHCPAVEREVLERGARVVIGVEGEGEVGVAFAALLVVGVAVELRVVRLRGEGSGVGVAPGESKSVG